MNSTKRIVINTLPQGPLTGSEFEVEMVDTPRPGEGEVLVRVQALTMGAGMRAGLQGSASYAGAPIKGQVMRGTGIGVVQASRAKGIKQGDRVVAEVGWQSHKILSADHVRVVPGDADPALHLGLMGINGLTAYFGLLIVGDPKFGETVVVSAAAGSVGHLVGQLAALKGCRVVGVAGSDAKCRLLVEELGFDVAINRKDEDFRDQFKAATPDRIGIYFDNTGGPVLGSALFQMAKHGRIVCCGAVSAYDTANPGPSPRGVPGLLVNNRVRMQGFMVFDFEDQYEDARDELLGWLNEGRISPRHVEYQGLESAPKAFVDLLAGNTVGTVIVRMAE